MNAALPMLFVTVGTDHHRFDRLAEWVQPWLDHRDGQVRCVYQHGASRAPSQAEPLGIVSRDELLEHLDAATVVLAQGGPGSILDARGRGFVPVVVPRLAALDEVVDDHQVAFCRRLAAEGQVILAESQEHLHAALDAAFADPATVRRPADPSPAPETAARLAEVVEQVVSRRPGFIAWRRLRSSR
ncbi:glycosyltransferase [Phytoactinopolyspora limicola]|uniref:glycosyltransferase n=1 Tax=Phytoactinopolyspora limicola TaxID=2715536 RepID=UPI00140A488C|nr:glycosyltransferase [Phytoactinopolyspora limicola]